ncbi:MAG: zf-HC2 domain-containing protein [Candidatus Solibacter usitatus]|nr:zf-HC2 domain-containing protein [Candidatus Solibacter usitatus]
MKCVDLETLLCDYVDGTLSGGEKATVELHLRDCDACRELVADCRAAVAFMETAAEVEPPPALVNTILFEARSGKAAPVKKAGGARSWLGNLLEPVLQPKFAMGMAMTVLSFSMIARFAGIPVRPLRAADLEPAKVWSTLEDKAYRSWERAKKYYESMRLVFEIQQTLRDWNEAEEPQDGKAKVEAQAPGQQKGGEAAMEGPIVAEPREGRNQKGSDGRAGQ